MEPKMANIVWKLMSIKSEDDQDWFVVLKIKWENLKGEKEELSFDSLQLILSGHFLVQYLLFLPVTEGSSEYSDSDLDMSRRRSRRSHKKAVNYCETSESEGSQAETKRSKMKPQRRYDSSESEGQSEAVVTAGICCRNLYLKFSLSTWTGSPLGYIIF